jgi:aminoglycoside N3'-acetyltransferase
MRSGAIVLLLGVLAFHVADVRAQLFKCVGKDGKVAYQAEPCPASFALLDR